jgi:pentatricopeptide repeat protein
MYQLYHFCHDRALRVLNDMDQAHVIPTVVTFNTLIESCARNGKAQRAREVLELMKKRGLNPDERSFSAVVQVQSASIVSIHIVHTRRSITSYMPYHDRNESCYHQCCHKYLIDITLTAEHYSYSHAVKLVK